MNATASFVKTVLFIVLSLGLGFFAGRESIRIEEPKIQDITRVYLLPDLSPLQPKILDKSTDKPLGPSYPNDSELEKMLQGK